MEIKLPVRGYHLDGYNHVNNARYLEFLEEARWQYYDNLSREALQNADWAFVIVNINIDYKYPATLGDSLRIHTEVDRVGSTSMTFQQTVYLNDTDTIVCSAKVTFVILDKKTGRPRPIEGELEKILKKEMSI
ncbi:acyl-CoA thioesterase [Parvicella tangerina]|nr:thioesterase family protein [Parvicella tangerina]